ncbi:MAG: glycolate oxidase subunit GlcF [Gammaproteobacteria bacterium]
MQTSFSAEFLQTKDGQRVNGILRKCVHCGFCNATCPTYQVTGDELDGPRGRIYLIKNFFEDQKEHQNSQIDNNIGLKHLDRCLTCLACETTCPSGVKYGELVDIGRKHIRDKSKRSLTSKLKRKLILYTFSKPTLSKVAFTLAQLLKPLLPLSLAKKVPSKQSLPELNSNLSFTKKVLTIKGCVQSSAAPQINAAAAKVFQNSEILIEETNSKCCGALAFHLTEINTAHQTIRDNIDNWYEKLTNGYEYLSITSSGCSSFIKQYSIIMQDDKDYAEKANFIAERCRDISELAKDIKPNDSDKKSKTVAFHSPCTLQHGQNINGVIEAKLQSAGYTLVDFRDGHLCCGSAGSYSLLEDKLSTELLNNKINCLEENHPDIIATANIGCLMHLQSGTDIPVKHWIELLN